MRTRKRVFHFPPSKNRFFNSPGFFLLPASGIRRYFLNVSMIFENLIVNSWEFTKELFISCDLENLFLCSTFYRRKIDFSILSVSSFLRYFLSVSMKFENLTVNSRDFTKELFISRGNFTFVSLNCENLFFYSLLVGVLRNKL